MIEGFSEVGMGWFEWSSMMVGWRRVWKRGFGDGSLLKIGSSWGWLGWRWVGWQAGNGVA